MNKQEVIQAMIEGKKVTHEYFTPNEYIYQNGVGEIYSEDGCHHKEFWEIHIGHAWEQHGWSIWEEPNKETMNTDITKKANEYWNGLTLKEARKKAKDILGIDFYKVDLSDEELGKIYLAEHPQDSTPTVAVNEGEDDLLEGYCRFNLNDYILVQITDYGWKELEKYENKSGNNGFTEHCIKSKKEVIGGIDYYRLQAHFVAETFGSMVWASSPAPIKPVILAETKSSYRGSTELKLSNDTLTEMNGHYITLCKNLEDENEKLKEENASIKWLLDIIVTSPEWIRLFGGGEVDKRAKALLNK